MTSQLDTWCVESERVAAVRSSLAIGDRQLDNGDGRAYTAETLDRITANAINSAKKGKSINPDIER